MTVPASTLVTVGVTAHANDDGVVDGAVRSPNGGLVPAASGGDGEVADGDGGDDGGVDSGVAVGDAEDGILASGEGAKDGDTTGVFGAWASGEVDVDGGDAAGTGP